MKTIIENSLEFSGVSFNARTLFNPNDNEKPHYYDLSKKAGMTIRVWYNWEEEGNKGSSWKRISVPEGLDELGVKNYILSRISS